MSATIYPGDIVFEVLDEGTIWIVVSCEDRWYPMSWHHVDMTLLAEGRLRTVSLEHGDLTQRWHVINE